MQKISQALGFIIQMAKAQVILTRRLDAGLGGLALNELIVLLELAQADEGLRSIDLAQRVGLTASAVTRLLLPMEKVGLVKRQSNKDDARSSLISMTAAGRRKLEEAMLRGEEFCEDNFPQIDSQQLQQFSLILGRLSGLTAMRESGQKYAQEAAERWGESELYKQSQERVKKLSKDDWQRIKEEGEQLMKEIVAQMSKGPKSAEVQRLIDRHYKGLRTFYEPNLKMYRGLGNMYDQDPRFSAYYEKFHRGLARFMKEAIEVYCDNH